MKLWGISQILGGDRKRWFREPVRDCLLSSTVHVFSSVGPNSTCQRIHLSSSPSQKATKTEQKTTTYEYYSNFTRFVLLKINLKNSKISEQKKDVKYVVLKFIINKRWFFSIRSHQHIKKRSNKKQILAQTRN